MATLRFDVEANYEEVIRLRNEVARLESQMKNFGNSKMDLSGIEKQYSESIAKLRLLTSEAAKSEAELRRSLAMMGGAKSGLGVGSGADAMTEGIMKANTASGVLRETLGGVNTTMDKLMGVLNGVGGAVGTAFGVGAIASFLGKVESVRTMFQDIESSMTVFLGSQEKANEFTSELKDYAFYNMFEYSQLANASKQLIAYGNDTKNVIPILDKLSNVASGTGASLEEMVFLYNKAKSTGVVDSKSIQSWAAKGVVLKDELKAMGVEAAGSTVTFNQLNDVLDRLTTGEGRFAGLMMEQMNNLSAARGQLQDNLDAMFNEIGEKMQPLLKGIIDAEGWLVDNYETVGKTILTLASTYGVYRTVIGLAHAAKVSELNTLRRYIEANIEGVEVGEESIRQDVREERSIRRKTEALREQLIARKNLIALSISESKAQIKVLEDDMTVTRDKLSRAKNGAEIEELKEGLSVDDELLRKEKTRLDELTKSYDKVGKVIGSVGEGTNKTGGIIKIFSNKVKEATLSAIAFMSANAVFLAVTAAVVALSVGIYKLATAQSAEEQAQERVNESLERYKALEDVEKASSEDYISVIKDKTKSIWEQNDAYEKLLSLYPMMERYTRDEIQGMSFEDVNKAVADAQNKERASYIEGKIKEVEASIADMYNVPTMSYGFSKEGVESTEAFKSANEELKLWNEEYDKYRQMRDDERMEGMSHEQRKTILMDSVEASEEANAVVKGYQDAIDSLTGNMEMSKEERMDAMLGRSEEAVGRVSRTIDEITAKINDANTSEDEKRRLQIRLTAQQKLLDRLQSMKESLQSWLNSSDPLVMSFTVDLGRRESGKKALGREGSSIYREYTESLKDIAASDYSDEFKAAKISDLIDVTVSKIKDAQSDINDKENKQYKNLEKLKSDLLTARTSGMSVAMSGIDTSLVKDLSKDTAQELSDSNKRLQQEQKNYGNYKEKLLVARGEYEDALAKVKDFERKMRNEEEYNEKDKKNADEALNTARSSYDALLKVSTKYNASAKAAREKALKDERSAIDQSFSTREADISVMKDGYGKELKELKLSFDKKKEQIKRGYEDLKTTRMAEAEKVWKANPDNVGAFSEAAYLASFKYTNEDMKNFNAQNEENMTSYLRGVEKLSERYETNAQKRTKERQKALEDIAGLEDSIRIVRESGDVEAVERLKERLALAKEIAKSLEYDKDKADYYKEYGTPSQRKNAIRDEYENQIAIARAEGRPDEYVRGLERKRESELIQVETDVLKSQIDWGTALGELGGSMKEYTKAVYGAALKYKGSEEFANMSADDQRAFLELLSQLKSSVPFSFARKDDGGYSTYDDAKKAVGKAIEDYNTALTEYAIALNGDDEKALDDAKKKVEEKRAEAEDITNSVVGSIGAFGDALNGLTGETLVGFAKSLESMSTLFGGKLNIDPITNAVLSLFDMFLENGFSGIVDKFFGLFNKIADNIIRDITSGSVIKTIVEGLTSTVLNVLTSFLGVERFDIIKTSEERFAELADKTQRLNNVFGDLIVSLEEDLEDLYGVDAVNKTEEIKEYYQKMIDSNRELGKAFLTTRDGWFGSKAQQKIAQNMTAESRKALLDSGLMTMRFWNNDYQYDMTSLLDMSAEEIEKFKKDYPQVFSELGSETQDYLNSIVESQKAIEDLDDQLRERLARTSFDNIYSSFLSTMKNLDASAEETASNISEYFFDAVMDETMAGKYKGELEKWYNEYADSLKDGLSDAEMREARAKYQNIINDAIEERNRIAEMTGYDEDYWQQSATSKGFQAMSQDTGDELNGRFAASQIAIEDIRDTANATLPLMTTSIAELSVTGTMVHANLTETQEILAKSLVSLQSIDTNILWMREKMEKKEGVFGDIAETANNTKYLR